MRKLISTSLVLFMTLFSFVTAANAQTTGTETKAAKTSSFFTTQPAPVSVSGTVTEVSDNKMTVKTADGKDYLVPLEMFSSMDGFGGLELAAGTEVTMKGAQVLARLSEAAEKQDGKITISIANPAGNSPSDFQYDLKDLADGEELFIAREISAHSHTVTLPAPAVERPAVSEISGTVTEAVYDRMTVNGTDGKTYVVPLGPFSQADGFEDLGLAAGAKVTMKGLQPPGKAQFSTSPALKGTDNAKTAIKMGTAVIKGDSTSSFQFDGSNLPDDATLFIATEISANEHTVSLPKTLAGKPAAAEVTGTVAEINDDQMKVKSEDGKTYVIPLDLLSGADGLDELAIAAGTKVTMKGLLPGNAKLIISSSANETDEPVPQMGVCIAVPSIDQTSGLPAKHIGVINLKQADDAGTILKPFNLEDNEILFIPEQVTANGNTVSLTDNLN